MRFILLIFVFLSSVTGASSQSYKPSFEAGLPALYYKIGNSSYVLYGATIGLTFPLVSVTEEFSINVKPNIQGFIGDGASVYGANMSASLVAMFGAGATPNGTTRYGFIAGFGPNYASIYEAYGIEGMHSGGVLAYVVGINWYAHPGYFSVLLTGNLNPISVEGMGNNLNPQVRHPIGISLVKVFGKVRE